MAKKESKKVLSGVKPSKLIDLPQKDFVPTIPTIEEDVNDPERNGFLTIEDIPANTPPLSPVHINLLYNVVKIVLVVIIAVICLRLAYQVFS